MTKLRDIVAIILLLTLCLLAIFQKMEALAIITVILIGVIVYRYPVRRLLDIGFDILRRTTSAKVGDLEFQTEQKSKDNSHLLTKQADWIRIILSDLSGEQIALLIAIHKAGKFPAKDKESLRVLRARGLLFHDVPLSLQESKEVWLTELGNEIASKLVASDNASFLPIVSVVSKE